MFEGDNISRLWIPSLCKLCCSCWCYKSNSVWPIIGKMLVLDWEIVQGLLQFAFPGSRSRFCNNFRLGISIFLLWRRKKGEQGLPKYYKLYRFVTLCLRNPVDRPDWKGLAGSRSMIPSPPWSMISWNIFSRCAVSLHNVYGAIWMNRWFFPLRSCSIWVWDCWFVQM